MDLHDELRRTSRELRDWERLRAQACRNGFSKYDAQAPGFAVAIGTVIQEIESRLARLLTLLCEDGRE